MADYRLGTDVSTYAYTTNVTASHNLLVSTNRMVAALVVTNDVNNVVSVTYDSDNSFTKAVAYPSGAEHMELWYINDSDLPTTPGSYPVTATIFASNSHTWVSVQAFENFSQGVVQNTTDILGNATDISITIDPVTSDAYCFSAMYGAEKTFDYGNQVGIASSTDIPTRTAAWAFLPASDAGNQTLTYRLPTASAFYVLASSFGTIAPSAVTESTQNAILFGSVF